MFDKTIGNYHIKLQGSLITVEYQGQLLKAFDTNPLYSVEKFNQTATKLELIVAKGKKSLGYPTIA